MKFSTAARSEARLRGRAESCRLVCVYQQLAKPSRPCLPRPAQAGEDPDFGSSADTNTEERAAPPLSSPPRRHRTRAGTEAGEYLL